MNGDIDYDNVSLTWILQVLLLQQHCQGCHSRPLGNTWVGGDDGDNDGDYDDDDSNFDDDDDDNDDEDDGDGEGDHDVQNTCCLA